MEDYISIPNDDVLAALETSEIAGGEVYVSENQSNIITRSDADVTVSTRSQLLNAASSNADIIWVDSDINLGDNKFELNSQILAGDRGQNGADGAMIWSNTKGQGTSAYTSSGNRGFIRLNGNSRATGLRFRGPTHNAFDHPEMPGYIPRPRGSESHRYSIYDRDRARCFTLNHDNAEIDNCEIWGFATQGISVGTHNNPSSPHVHHNYIHDNMQTSMGYGVDVRRGIPTIEYNYFNAHRHSINGGGRWNCGYELQYNVFGPAASSHLVDMHRLGNNISSGSTNFNDRDYFGNAGGNLDIRRNTFLGTIIPNMPDSEVNSRSNLSGDWYVFDGGSRARAIAIRGTPWPRSGTACWIRDNRFLHEGPSGFNNPTNYRNPIPDVAFQQQMSSGDFNIPSSQRDSRNFGVNFDVGENLYDSENESEFDFEKGAPVDIHAGGGTRTAQLRVYAEDSETSERLTGVTVTVQQDDGDIDPPGNIEYGSTVTMPGDTSSSAVTAPEGVVIEPQRDLEGVRARISSNASGFSRMWLAALNDEEFASIDVSNREAGDRVMLPAILHEGEQYLLWLDNDGDSYTRGVSDADHPYPSDDIDVTGGVYTDSSNILSHRRYNWESVQAVINADQDDIPEPPEPPEHDVHASEGPSAIQSALNSASSGATVRVGGTGEFTWDSEITVPNGVTLDVENTVSVTVPSNHNLSTFTTGSRQVYGLITNADRSNASNVTIRGGTYDMSNMTGTSIEYAGIWLHNASNSLIDDVEMHGSGTPIRGSGSYRGFGITLTACTDSEIRDSEAYDSAYDDITARGRCEDCRIVRSGGSGGGSGTIQTANWGHWNIGSRPRRTEYIDCWGRRIYCHSGIDTVMDGCESHYRLQMFGVGNSCTFKNSQDFEGKVLIYTLDNPQPYTLVENMEFASGGRNIAIQIGPNSGQNIGDVEIDDCWANRRTFIHFNDYSTSATIGTVEVTNSEINGTGSGSEIISKDANVGVGTLAFYDCEFDNFDTGIVGSYDTVIVENCTFHNLSESEAINVNASVQTSGNTYN